ncbi:MAG: 30S ribosome-binding factor RbfA [Bacteroidetes bacterium]|nr:30S ribosome-binding factor RbfA [Bacteroidota bacterium]
MQEGKRQKQVAALLHEELSNVFQHLGLNMIDGGMVSISSVKISPDLFDAKIYLSFFKVPDRKAAMKKIEERSWEIKKELVNSIKRQLRSMPQLSFLVDESLDYVDKMEALFKEIKSQEFPGNQQKK